MGLRVERVERSEPSSSVRSTVATTRSKRRSGAASATGAGYPQPRRGPRPRVRRPRSPRRRADDRGGGARACSGRRAATSSSSSSTTARPTRRASSSARSTTPGCGSSATTSRSASPARSTSGSTPPRGRYLARMDADDIALAALAGDDRSGAYARRRQRRRRHGDDRPATRTGASARSTGCPAARRAVRWAALFSSPFFHSTVVVDRAVLDEHGLRYDPSFAESEDYDLWARLLGVADGDNVREALVLYRKHEAQASARRAELQRECQRRVALRQIAALAPRARRGGAELAWLAGAGLPLHDGTVRAAADALGRLVESFERRHGGDEARRAAAWSLARRACVERRPRAARDAGAAARSGAPGRRARGGCGAGTTHAPSSVAARSWLRAGTDAPGRRHVRPPRADAVSDGDARPSPRIGPSSS